MIVCMTFILTGCGNNENNTSGGTENSGTFGGTNNSSAKKPNHKIYKYIKISSDNSNNLLYSVTGLFDNPSVVSRGETYYKPCIVAEFDTETGKATKATYYAFFIDYEDDQWVNKSIEKYNNSSSEAKKYFTNVQKGRVSDEISYLSADIDVNSYQFTQFIDTYLIKSQDIEKYKDEVYYSRLYNYPTTPPCEVGDNYFEESLEQTRIDWSDSQIKAF